MLTDFAGVGKMKRMDATTAMQNLNFIDAEAATRGELLRKKGSEGVLVGFTVLTSGRAFLRVSPSHGIAFADE